MTDHDEIATLHQEAVQQRARIRRLEEALRWYRDQNAIAQTRTIAALNARERLDVDRGYIAANALQEAGQ